MTNFTGLRSESRPFARGGRSCTREGLQAPTGPGGWVQGRTGAPTVRRGRCTLTTHSRPPAGVLRGPLRCQGLLSGVGPAWLGTRYSPPVYPPGYPPSIPTLVPYPDPYTAAGPLPGAGTHRSYSRFWTTVGEPRGVRTHVYFRVPDWFIYSIKVYTAV